jgi:hypothetical protein
MRVVALDAVGISRVASRLWMAAVGDLVAGIPIALARNAINAVRSDPLLQLFHFQDYFFFHTVLWVFFFTGLGAGMDKPPGDPGLSIHG